MKLKLGYLVFCMVLKVGFFFFFKERSNFCKDDVLEIIGYNGDGCYDLENYYVLYILVNYGDKRIFEDLFNKVV